MKREINIDTLARINKVVLAYYSESERYKTEANYKTWLQTLDPVLREHFDEQGFETGKNSIPFMRFALELNDYGMDDFLKRHLSDADFSAWKYPDTNLIVPQELNILNGDDKGFLT